MKLTVLGCSGGIGGPHLATTSLLVDDDILIDAGTGVCTLDVQTLARIDRIFLTHAHLDHIAGLPLLLDSVMELRNGPVQVHAIPEVIAALQAHVFNDLIWPDFSSIPSKEKPIVVFSPLPAEGCMALGGGRTLRTLPARHTVPAVGYWLDSGQGSLVFSGDTTVNPDFWPLVNRIGNLQHLLIECAFPNQEDWLARRSLHLCPSLLVEELAQLEHPCRVYISHLKPSQGELTMREIADSLPEWQPIRLEQGQEIEF